jgi:RimJ/RimL family protein N-acetyltransferase
MRGIDTPRMKLEPQTAAHAPEMFAVLSDMAIYEYENEPPHSLEWLQQRFTRLESRQSPDGREQWLNWVLRLRGGGGLIGYVQATVHANGRAGIAYELSSAYWGRGLAQEAVRAMIDELARKYQVHSLSAVLKQRNQRSARLLQRLGFEVATPQQHAAAGVEADELLMQRPAVPAV